MNSKREENFKKAADFETQKKGIMHRDIKEHKEFTAGITISKRLINSDKAGIQTKERNFA